MQLIKTQKGQAKLQILEFWNPLHCPRTTSQQADLIALTRDLIVARIKLLTFILILNMPIISSTHMQVIWQERGFLTTQSTPIINDKLTLRLLKAAKKSSCHIQTRTPASQQAHSSR